MLSRKFVSSRRTLSRNIHHHDSHACRGVHESEKELTFAELLFEIRIAAAFLVEVEAVADENPSDADGNADCGFGDHGHSNIQIPDVLQMTHETLVETSAIMEKVAFLVVRAEHAREMFARRCTKLNV